MTKKCCGKCLKTMSAVRLGMRIDNKSPKGLTAKWIFGIFSRRTRNFAFIAITAVMIFLIHSANEYNYRKLNDHDANNGGRSSEWIRQRPVATLSAVELLQKQRNSATSRQNHIGRQMISAESKPTSNHSPKALTNRGKSNRSLDLQNNDEAIRDPQSSKENGFNIVEQNRVVSAGSETMVQDLIIAKKRRAKHNVSEYKNRTHVSSKISEKETNLPKLNHPSNSEKFWLSKFTSNIPGDLLILLQDILARDFERENSTSPGPNEGMEGSGRCKRGYFRLRGMDNCHSWLRCDDIKRIDIDDDYGNGVGKIVSRGRWKGVNRVAVVKLRQDRFKYSMFVNRVQSGVENILLTQPSPYTTQVVGYCVHGNNTVLVMEGCTEGNFRQFFSGPTFRRSSIIDKFKIAIQLVAELDYLHRGMGKPRLNCDLHTPIQSFGQYTVTYDYRLFLNDLDELPVIDKENGQLATCEGEPYGIMAMPAFMSPEIRYTAEEHSMKKHFKPVDEKSDVWKIPDLVSNIMTIEMGQRLFAAYSKDSQYYLKILLEPIHQKCKLPHPEQRPSSREVLIQYLQVYQNLLDERPKE